MLAMEYLQLVVPPYEASTLPVEEELHPPLFQSSPPLFLEWFPKVASAQQMKYMIV